MKKLLLALATMLVMGCSHMTDKLAPLDEGATGPTAAPPVVRLNKNGEFYCTAVVIGKNYALTAAHCLLNTDKPGLLDGLEVLSEDQTQTVPVKAEKVNMRVDVGLISGDFSGFSRLVVSNETLGLSEGLASCGYPGGNKKINCQIIKPEINDGFQIKAMGYLVGGMSGGPVINPENNQVVGINVGMRDLHKDGGGMDYAPLFGSLGFFDIEP